MPRKDVSPGPDTGLMQDVNSVRYSNDVTTPDEDVRQQDETQAMITFESNEEPSTNYVKGAQMAISAFLRNWSDQNIYNLYKNQVFGTVWKICLVLYILLTIAAILLFPIVIVLLFYSPGTLWQISVLVPLWAWNINQKIRPLQLSRMFIEGLRPLDEEMANNFVEKMENNTHLHERSWMRAIIENIQESSYFFIYSLLCFAFSLIPIVGSIVSAVGETYLVAKSLSWRLTEVYTVSIERMDFNQRKVFVQIYRICINILFRHS